MNLYSLFSDILTGNNTQYFGVNFNTKYLVVRVIMLEREREREREREPHLQARNLSKNFIKSSIGLPFFGKAGLSAFYPIAMSSDVGVMSSIVDTPNNNLT
jgi:hypothetical protein